MSEIVETLICEIKDKYHLKYDEDVADIANISASHLNRMKKREGQPNAANFVRLAINAGWTMEKANKVLNGGYIALPLLFVTGFGSALALAWSYISPTVYIMLN